MPFNKVIINDNFWSPRIETNRQVTIPYDFRKCEETGTFKNTTLTAIPYYAWGHRGIGNMTVWIPTD